MLKGVHPGFYDISDPHPHPFSGRSPSSEYNDRIIDKAIFGSDEFRMFAYKIKRCPRMRSHDWTECPYAHKGEKAQRRDPRKYDYSAITCPAFRNGKCHKGELCEYAHGVFEYWLHPARYRTRVCNAGKYCTRKVCFFAHTPEQLRVAETKHNCSHHHHHQHHHNYVYRVARMGELIHGEDGAGHGTATSAVTEECLNKKSVDDSLEKFSAFLKSLRELKLTEHKDEGSFPVNSGLDWDLAHVDWISDLVQ